MAVYSQQSPHSLAMKMDELLLSPERLARARKAAWRLGQERYNWDIEQNDYCK